MNIPKHVAIILDGNGRWAKSKGMPRTYGHIEGAKNVERICEEAWKMGIKYLTVYAFSTENWKRSEEEIAAIMGLLKKYLFEAIEKKAHTGGQFSFEERMGCGFGACMGCTCKTEHGNKRICKEGPVLEREEILW